jgi:hypothetical protein
MKKLFTVIFILSALLAATATQAEIFDEITSGIKTGDVKLISKNFNSSIDLTVGAQENTYSKIQAEQILREFFAINKPSGFTLIHQGLSKEGAKYAIGALTTAQGKNFRVYMYIKQVGNAYFINELRFMPE